MSRSQYPEDFLFGVASAAYQIEGAVAEDGRVPSQWDLFPPRDRETLHRGFPDHYHRYRDDVALLARLGVSSYRFSLAWPRLFTEDRKPNPKGLAFYHRLLDALDAAHIVPLVTLYHWDLPQWLVEKGGWAHRDTARYFTDFAELALTTYGDRVPLWITLHDPQAEAFLGYGRGIQAPGRQNWVEALQAAHHLLLAHGWAVQGFRGLNLKSRMGIALTLTPILSASPREEDRLAAERADALYNRWFLDPLIRGQYPADLLELFQPLMRHRPWIQEGDFAALATPLDFLGVNFFGQATARHHQLAVDLPGLDVSLTPINAGLGAAHDTEEVPSPTPLYDLLRRLARDYPAIPLVVTANGLLTQEETPDPDGRIRDVDRQRFLAAHLEQVAQALGENLPVQGYYAWAFLDGFEWAHGSRRQSGLVYVDATTRERRLKESAVWYQAFLAGEADL
ncbi:MAG: family 1 glycosylhydrolase [Firmicutes bacterium]|nr:family 1 glycosylhydrolase [Bacillota bacterium]